MQTHTQKKKKKEKKKKKTVQGCDCFARQALPNSAVNGSDY